MQTQTQTQTQKQTLAPCLNSEAYGTWNYLQKKFPEDMDGIIPFSEIIFEDAPPCKDIIGVALLGNYWMVMCHYDKNERMPEQVSAFCAVKKTGENTFCFEPWRRS